MPRRRRATAARKLIPSVKTVGKPLPYTERCTGDITVNRMHVLRHQVIVQDLDTLKSSSYRWRGGGGGFTYPGSTNKCTGLLLTSGRSEPTMLGGGLGSGNGRRHEGSGTFGSFLGGECSNGGLLISAGLLGQAYSVSTDPRPVTFLQIPNTGRERGSTAIYDLSTGGVCGGRSMPQQYGQPGFRLR